MYLTYCLVSSVKVILFFQQPPGRIGANENRLGSRTGLSVVRRTDPSQEKPLSLLNISWHVRVLRFVLVSLVFVIPWLVVAGGLPGTFCAG